MKLSEILIGISKSDRNILINNMSAAGLSELLMEISGTPEEYKKSGATSGALIGAGIGAAGATGIWAAKRLALQRRLKTCDELSGDEKIKCRNAIEDQIEELSAKAMAGGVAATAAGAGLGGYIGRKRGYSKYTKLVNKENEAKEAEEIRRRKEEEARAQEMRKKQEEEAAKKASEDEVAQRVAQYRANKEKEAKEKEDKRRAIEDKRKAQPGVNLESISSAEHLLEQANKKMSELYVRSKDKKRIGINRLVYSSVTRMIAQAKSELSRINLKLDYSPDTTSKLVESVKKKIKATEDKLEKAISSAGSADRMYF